MTQITIIKSDLLDHLNHGVRRLFPLLVTQLDKDQLKPHSLLLQARLKVINEILKDILVFIYKCRKEQIFNFCYYVHLVIIA